MENGVVIDVDLSVCCYQGGICLQRLVKLSVLELSLDGDIWVLQGYELVDLIAELQRECEEGRHAWCNSKLSWLPMKRKG